ncbi:MAG: hypothetical protein ACRDLB_16280, partial [Actinomycetota bacterium]
MARVILGSYMVRYPLGGMMSWVLQYLVGLHRLGHETYFVEKAGWPDACFDPDEGIMSDDCSFGVRAVGSLLTEHSLADRWCFVDNHGRYFGLPKEDIEEVFRTADIFLDMGTHGSWAPEAADVTTALIDGEPGFTQMKMAAAEAAGVALPTYDYYFTTGRTIGTGRSTAPTAGREWIPIFHPVVPALFEVGEPTGDRYTTIMNWQSYGRLEHEGTVFGHKDLEFVKFEGLPQLVEATLEIAVSGMDIPADRLESQGWLMRDAHEVTRSFTRFKDYVRASRGEFGVCKNGFVATRSGWFSDRSAAYLAAGRPVVLQDTGFSEHLPCGEGLFAVATAEEAADAIDLIEADYDRHASKAREI